MKLAIPLLKEFVLRLQDAHVFLQLDLLSHVVADHGILENGDFVASVDIDMRVVEIELAFKQWITADLLTLSLQPGAFSFLLALLR